MAKGLQHVTNFLVPATGSTNAFLVRETFSATPIGISFQNVQLDGLPFRPSGVIIDNSQGTDNLIVLINEISFSIVCAAGQALQLPYPAPFNHTVSIVGEGMASVIFVDYPVIPFTTASGGGTTNGLTDAQLRAEPVVVTGDDVGGVVDAEMFDVTAAGVTTSGAAQVSFSNIGTADATVAGGTLSPGESISFDASFGRFISEISYDATGTTLRVALLA